MFIKLFWINVIIILFLTIPLAQSQNESIYKQFITTEGQGISEFLNAEDLSYYTNDPNFDISFYHLTLQPSLDTNFLLGHVSYLAKSNKDNLTKITIDLSNDFTITNHKNIDWIDQQERYLIIGLENSYMKGEYFTFELTYEGYPTLLNGIKGLNYRLADENKPLIVSLSTPYLGHQWWPCKDGPENKADSVYVDIILPDIAIQNKQLIGISNGVLESVVHESNSSGNFAKYEWRHRYPIPPYYIMMAVSNYLQFQENYQSPQHDDFPLEYFVFEDHLEPAMTGTEDLPSVMSYFETIFGPYPFSKEKYGMTQLGFYGGIENQTNTIINRMSVDYFMVSVHELAHMWFGDKLTCANWHDAWLNEGFASYAECLWIEHAFGEEAYHNYIANKKYFDGGSIYLNDIDDPFNIFISIIYSKGSWFLHMLRKVMGDTAFFNAIYDYSNNETWAYGNVDFTDFKLICQQESNQDLDPFFDQWLFGTYYPIYLYNYEQDNDHLLKLYIKQDQLEQLNTTTIFSMPIEVQLNFEDGTDTLLTIQNTLPYQEYEIQFLKKVDHIELDPNDWILSKAEMDQTVNNIYIPQTKIRIYPNPIIAGETLTLSSFNEVSEITLTGQSGDIFPNISYNSFNYLDNIAEIKIPKSFQSGRYTLNLILKDNQKLNLPFIIINN